MHASKPRAALSGERLCSVNGDARVFRGGGVDRVVLPRDLGRRCVRKAPRDRLDLRHRRRERNLRRDDVGYAVPSIQTAILRNRQAPAFS